MIGSNATRMEDRFGPYYYLTGNEHPRTCFWCGADVDGRRRYCCEEHRTLYLESFHWPDASMACRRHSPDCGDCGLPFRRIMDGDVHHKTPLNGGDRLWNALNRQENLVRLCESCHGTTRQKTRQLVGARDFEGCPREQLRLL